jgi:FtsH-binding integral membrane protein
MWIRRREAVLDYYKIALGLFFFVSPWLLAYASGAARLDAWATGATIVVLSVAALVVFAEWEEWLSLLTGLWLIIVPWVLGFAHTRAMHWSIGVGIVVVFIAALEIWLVRFDPDQEQQRPTPS